MLKALVVIDNLKVGGIGTSLYNFLAYACEKINIDLLVFDPSSIDLERLPKKVNIIKTPKLLRMLGMSQEDIKNYSKSLFLYRAFLVIISRLFGGHFSRKFIFSSFKKFMGYDIAISYAHDDPWKALTKGCNDFVINKVVAKYKVGFIHCDYKNFGGYEPEQEKSYQKFDRIVCVSESCKKNFEELFPRLSNKACVCENFINIEDICIKSKNAVHYDIDGTVFVSACRLSVVKGLDRAINAFSRLNNEGFNKFKWIIIGDGPEGAKLEDMIIKNGLGDKIQLIGEKKNPYHYMKNANVFLLPSIHEAAPMVFGECAAMGVPIVTTKTCSADELVAQRGLGIVCENSEDGIYNCLKKILSKNMDESMEMKADTESINANAMKQLDSLLQGLTSNLE